MRNTSTPVRFWDLEALQTRFALRVRSRLNEAAAQMPADVEERLRFAREQALERARAVRTAAAPAAVSNSALGATLALAGGASGSPWWMRLASLLPLVVLLAGLTIIQQRHSQAQIEAAAEIDAALLADDLPPAAYSDPGFGEYLRFPQD